MKNEILKLLIDGNFSTALDLCASFTSMVKNYDIDLISLRSRFSDNETDMRRGVISEEKFSIEQNIIVSSLIEIVHKIDDFYHTVSKSESKSHSNFVELLKMELIDQFKLTTILSEDSETVNYLAEEVHYDRRVVVKGIKRRITEEMKREIEYLKKVRHRNIISVIGQSNKDSIVDYVVFDYILGRKLNRLVHELGRRTVTETRIMLLKICEAVSYLHKKKILDFNLSPSSIFIDLEGEPIISAFDMIRTKGNSNENYLEALRYNSYERLVKDTNNFNYKEDIFSIGAIGYFLYKGEDLFNEKNMLLISESRNKYERSKDYRNSRLSKLDPNLPLDRVLIKLLTPACDTNCYNNVFDVKSDLEKMENPVENKYADVQNSFLRASAFCPRISMILVENVLSNNLSADDLENIDIELLGNQVHFTMNLIIESNNKINYLEKVSKYDLFNNVFMNDHELFQKHLFLLLKESDYLWSDELQENWSLVLKESKEINIQNAPNNAPPSTRR